MNEVFETNYVTLGGVTLGVIIIAVHIVRWKLEGNELKDLLLPFLPLILFGMLIILSAGGVMGNAANTALWGSNEVGKVVLVQGVGGTNHEVTRAANIVLDPNGHAVVAVLTAVFLAYLFFNKSARGSIHKGAGILRKIIQAVRANFWKHILPVVAGASLGLASGVAGFAASVLGPGVDTLGALTFGSIS